MKVIVAINGTPIRRLQSLVNKLQEVVLLGRPTSEILRQHLFGGLSRPSRVPVIDSGKVLARPRATRYRPTGPQSAVACQVTKRLMHMLLIYLNH